MRIADGVAHSCRCHYCCDRRGVRFRIIFTDSGKEHAIPTCSMPYLSVCLASALVATSNRYSVSTRESRRWWAGSSLETVGLTRVTRDAKAHVAIDTGEAKGHRIDVLAECPHVIVRLSLFRFCSWGSLQK